MPWLDYRDSNGFLNGSSNPNVPNNVIDKKNVRSAGSMDPNEKTGPAVYGPQAFVSVNAVLPYRIDFENDRTATAPAQTVFVTDQLSANFEWGSFMLTEIGFGDTRIEIPAGLQQYETVIPMSYGGVDFEVHVQAGLDSATGLLTVRFMSIDPVTGLPPANSNAGFLPPEDGTGCGMGFIKYTVMPKAGLPTGTELRNIALITFDFIETIATNQIDPHDPSKGTNPDLECLSRIDGSAPASQVAALPAAVRPIFTVNWGGADDSAGSGVRDYTVMVSTNGGPYTTWLARTEATSGIFVGQPLTTYSFYSLAADNVGNTQAAPAAADTTTTTQSNPYDEWRLAKFTTTEIATTSLTDATADPDHDGLPNLLEYAFGTDPKLANAAPTTASASGNKIQISFPCDATRTDITYTVQSSTTLAPNSWTDIAKSTGGATTLAEGTKSTVSDAGSGMRTVTVTDSTALPAGGKRFLRVKVSSP